MAATYRVTAVGRVGTLSCDRCGDLFDDGLPETEYVSLRMRAARFGWVLHYPWPGHRSVDRCPDCGYAL